MEIPGWMSGCSGRREHGREDITVDVTQAAQASNPIPILYPSAYFSLFDLVKFCLGRNAERSLRVFLGKAKSVCGMWLSRIYMCPQN